jgi:transcriptional regulator with XRE-family HTH domain
MIINSLLSLGRSIAQERLKQNLTQLALAARGGVAYSTLRKIESTGQGSMGHYAAIWQALGQPEPLLSTSAHFASQSQPRKRARAARTPPAATPPQPSPQETLRPSQKLGLSFPYDWSNPAISDTALIGKVLDRARFMDVSKTFAHYGHARVESVAADLGIDLTSGVLGSLIPGIKRGLEINARKVNAHV